MLVGQLSDLHVVARGEDRFGFDTGGLAAQAVAHLNGLDPVLDVVVVTGDVANEGHPAEYEHARAVLDELSMPYWVVPGNHDRRGPMVEAFDGHLYLEDGFVQYTVEQDGWPARLVLLDTLVEGQDHGELRSRQLAWLDRTLRTSDTPTMLCFHHPPVGVGIGWMDDQALRETDELSRVLSAHPHVQLLACGHLHREISAHLGAVRVAVASSTAPESIALTLGDERRAVCFDPPRAALHAFVDGRFVTHTTFWADGGLFPLSSEA